jgi:hypothetical protein
VIIWSFLARFGVFFGVRLIYYYIVHDYASRAVLKVPDVGINC